MRKDFSIARLPGAFGFSPPIGHALRQVLPNAEVAQYRGGSA
jgi:hypothetical protein